MVGFRDLAEWRAYVAHRGGNSKKTYHAHFRSGAMPSRRAVLGTLGVTTVSAFSGCSWLQSRDGSVGLTIFNQTDAAYTVEVGFFTDGASEPTARAYSSSLDVQPDGEVTREAVVEAKRYLVRYRAYEEHSRLTDEDHVHFIPSGDGTESLTFDIRETGELTRR